ncbi:MAG: hypothetical protein ACNA8L_12325 [Luteolibacter sp.]|jgi:hypothetical protein
MKTKTTPALAATLGAIVALITPVALGQSGTETAPGQIKKLPVIPAGWIDAYPTIVQTGTHPTLTWGINYPSQVADVAKLNGNATVVAVDEVSIECRVLGNGVTAHWPDGRWEFVPAEGFVSFNGSAFEKVFDGTNASVNPNEIVWQRTEIQPNDTVKFGGRYKWGNTTGPLYSSDNGTQNVRVFTDGQLPPSYAGIHPGVPSVEDFIKPYVGSDGRINIGPLDMIVLMELTHTDAQQQHEGYDLQDLVMLVTVKPKPKNNNRSGLGDGTNPGQGNQMGNNDGTDNPNQAPHSGGSN